MTTLTNKQNIKIESLNSPVSETFKKGEYLIGDLCYIFPENERHDYVNKNFETTNGQGKDMAGAILNYKGINIFTCATAFGDGYYPVIKDGKEFGNFGVDAGMTALIPLELAKTWPKYKENKKSYVLIEVKKDFEIEVFGKEARPGNWRIKNGVDNFEILTDYDEDEENDTENNY